MRPLYKRYEEIVDKCCELSHLFFPLVLLFDEWRDKFEGATVKKNYRNVHANTISFLGPAASHTNPHYAYTVCIGSGSFNSIYAENELSPDLLCLTSQVNFFYSGIEELCCQSYCFLNPPSKTNLRDVTVYLHTSIQQLPTWWWGWGSNINYAKLVSCLFCHWKHLQLLSEPITGDLNLQTCYNCGDFNYTMVPHLSWYLVIDAYPI
jgi:hypothetical protein